MLQLNATRIIANLREKLLLVGFEAEMLLYFLFFEADDVAKNVLIFFDILSLNVVIKKVVTQPSACRTYEEKEEQDKFPIFTMENEGVARG